MLRVLSGGMKLKLFFQISFKTANPMDEVVLKLNRVREIDKILTLLPRIEKSTYKYLS